MGGSLDDLALKDYRDTLDPASAQVQLLSYGGQTGTDPLATWLDDDVLYEGGPAGALRQPTFLGNHDAGRFAMFLKAANPRIDPEELLQRDMLGHAMLLSLRGVPVIYSGDEQGFAGHGGDQALRVGMARTGEQRGGLAVEAGDRALVGQVAPAPDPLHQGRDQRIGPVAERTGGAFDPVADRPADRRIVAQRARDGGRRQAERLPDRPHRNGNA